MSTYSSIRNIGRGGFGVVDEVSNERGERFARKSFAPAPEIPAQHHDKLRKRFKREVMIQAELGGAELMPVLDHSLDGEEPWFVMPLASKTYEKQNQRRQIEWQRGRERCCGYTERIAVPS